MARLREPTVLIPVLQWHARSEQCSWLWLRHPEGKRARESLQRSIRQGRIVLTSPQVNYPYLMQTFNCSRKWGEDHRAPTGQLDSEHDPMHGPVPVISRDRRRHAAPPPEALSVPVARARGDASNI